jgi:hypothetical protein
MGLELTDLGEISEQPLEHIPDAWARKGACPVCRASQTLDITHSEDAPDQFVCQDCGVAFEVQSSGGPQIRIKVIPEVLKTAWRDVFDRWMEPADLQVLFQRYHAEQQHASPKKADTPVESVLSDHDVMKRVVELKRLGNDNETVGLLLYQAGATTPQIKAALHRYQNVTRQQTKGRSQALGWMIASSILILIVLLGIAWMMYELGFINLTSPATTEKADVVAELLPVDAFTDIPMEATPEAVRGGPKASACPTSKSQAATLFGGNSSYWDFKADSRAWMMINADSPVTVRVPANMFAGYLNLETMELKTVSGSALIRNANVVAILCE